MIGKAWKGLNHRTGCDLKHIVKILTDSTIINQDVREKAIRFVTQHLDKFLCTRERPRNKFLNKIAQHICIGMRNCAPMSVGVDQCELFLLLGKQYGNYVISVYFFVKSLYFTNALGQLFLLNYFVGENYTIYGIEVLSNLIHGRDTGESPRFPRSTLCSFKVREFGGNTHRHTVQCVLPINLFNEKIYLFIWFWLVFVTIFTLLSILLWLWDFIGHTRIQFIKRYIKMVPHYPYDRKTDRKSVQAFATHYLRQDGVFILRLIGKNVNEVILCEIILALYEIFKSKHYNPKVYTSQQKLNKDEESLLEP